MSVSVLVHDNGRRKEIFQTDDMKRPAMLLFTIGGNRGVLTADEKSNRGGRI
jgi:hypothetical protein